MKTVTRGLLAASLLLSCAQTAAAQSADEVIERHLAAIGGRTALEKLTSRVGTGKITLATPAGDISGPIEVTNARPNKERTLLSLDLSAAACVVRPSVLQLGEGLLDSTADHVRMQDFGDGRENRWVE